MWALSQHRTLFMKRNFYLRRARSFAARMTKWEINWISEWLIYSIESGITSTVNWETKHTQNVLLRRGAKKVDFNSTLNVLHCMTSFVDGIAEFSLFVPVSLNGIDFLFYSFLFFSFPWESQHSASRRWQEIMNDSSVVCSLLVLRKRTCFVVATHI